MNTVYTLAFTFFLLTSQSDTDVNTPSIALNTEREIAYYDREGGPPVRSMEECKIVAARRKQRAEEAIRNSPGCIFEDRVKVTCFEYEKPAAKKRHKK